jgi:hypothetical protein
VHRFGAGARKCRCIKGLLLLGQFFASADKLIKIRNMQAVFQAVSVRGRRNLSLDRAALPAVHNRIGL